MSELQYSSYEGFGSYSVGNAHYSQAVRVGDIVKISGQGGWEIAAPPLKLKPTGPEQAKQAFMNVDHTLKDAGVARGWDAVYATRMYVSKEAEETVSYRPLIEQLRQWCPNHQPLLTLIIVHKLAFDMAYEIEVEAYDPRK